MGEWSKDSGASPRVTAAALLARVLVVSGSSLFRDLVKLLLRPHAREVLVADSLEDALRALSRHAPIDVAICELDLPDGTGFDLLRRREAGTDVRVILVCDRMVEATTDRAVEEGAIGCLAKPISYRHIASALKRSEEQDPRAIRRRPGGRVAVLSLDDGTGKLTQPQILCYARDVSATGAFLETEFPLPTGSRLGLAIELGHMRISLQAEVVRVQEPGWGHGGGVGVHFTECSELGREALSAYVSLGGADAY